MSPAPGAITVKPIVATRKKVPMNSVRNLAIGKSYTLRFGFSGHRNKTYRKRAQGLESARRAAEDSKLLHTNPDRDRHQAADLQLLDQRRWNGIRRGRHHHAIERRLL